MAKKHTVGCVPDGRIAIIDHKGAVRGHVGPYAIAATVQRFGVKEPILKRVRGKLEWHGQRVPQRRQPETADHKAARGSVPARRGS